MKAKKRLLKVKRKNSSQRELDRVKSVIEKMKGSKKGQDNKGY